MKKILGRTYRRRIKKKLEVVNNPENSCHKNQILCKWMGEKGYKAMKTLKPKLFPGYGQGLLTEDAIRSGDMILAIPQNLLITSELVLQSEVGHFIKKYCRTATGHEILSLFLMTEKAKGLVSEWHPYIETLPESYNIPAFYGSQCLPSIPSFIYSQAAKQVESVENSFKNLSEVLKHLEYSFPFLHGNMDFRMFKWAWCAINTRCVFIDCFKKDCVGKFCKFHLALAPFLDFLNHNVEVQVQAGFNKISKQYEIVSLCNYKKYSQVFINYGSHDNCSLLLEYGFVVPNNYNDTISFSIGDVTSAYQQSEFSSDFLSRKLQFILENNLIQNSVCSCDGLSWNMNIILKILALDNLKWQKTKDRWKATGKTRCNYEELTSNEDCFKKLQKILISAKLKEYSSNSFICVNICEYTSLQLPVNQLLTIFNSILIKTLE